MAFVADNSVIVAWFVKSQATPYTWSILERAAAGEAYARESFEALQARLCDALRGDRPRVAATVHAPDGRTRILFEDGTAGDA